MDDIKTEPSLEEQVASLKQEFREWQNLMVKIQKGVKGLKKSIVSVTGRQKYLNYMITRLLDTQLAMAKECEFDLEKFRKEAAEEIHSKYFNDLEL